MIETLLSKLFKHEEINGHERCPAYMHRWTLFQPRWARSFWRGFGVYVHKFVGDDWTRDLHDHPKRFISIGLVGRYIEHTPVASAVLPGVTQARIYVAPWVRSFPAIHRHRLTLIDGEPCWTLVIVLRTVREWGFWPAGVWVPWREYVKPGSKAADDGRLC
jgi:hypothetical protein